MFVNRIWLYTEDNRYRLTFRSLILAAKVLDKFCSLAKLLFSINRSQTS